MATVYEILDTLTYYEYGFTFKEYTFDLDVSVIVNVDEKAIWDVEGFSVLPKRYIEEIEKDLGFKLNQ